MLAELVSKLGYRLNKCESHWCTSFIASSCIAWQWTCCVFFLNTALHFVFSYNHAIIHVRALHVIYTCALTPVFEWGNVSEGMSYPLPRKSMHAFPLSVCYLCGVLLPGWTQTGSQWEEGNTERLQYKASGHDLVSWGRWSGKATLFISRRCIFNFTINDPTVM